MAEVKGVLLNGWMRFLKKRFGDAAVAAALQACSPEDRAILSGVFLAASWYPYDFLHTLRRLTRSLARPTDQHLATEIGRAMANHVFTGVYHPLLAQAPSQRVEMFQVTVEFSYREAIRVDARMIDDTSCAVRYVYEGGARPSRAICESIAGFWSQTLELTGASSAEYEHPECMAGGHPSCQFTFRWRA